MVRSKIAGIGMYVPERVFTNQDMLKYMDTSDEWIQERTGIKERHFAHRTDETTATMGSEAAKIAIERAGITPQDIDSYRFATLSPDYYFPAVVYWIQQAMKMKDIGALDVRNQCSGFVYALSGLISLLKQGCIKISWWLVQRNIHSGLISAPVSRKCIRDLWWRGRSRSITTNRRYKQGNTEHTCIATEQMPRYLPCTILVHANHWVKETKLADFKEAEIGRNVHEPWYDW